MNPSLKFDESNINLYADKYNDQINEDNIIDRLSNIQARLFDER